MQRSQKLRVCAITALLLVTGISGCAATASGSDAKTASGNTTASIAQMPREMFPLNEFLDAVWGTVLSPDEMTARHELRWQRQQELISLCMHNLGFEYDPFNLPFFQGGAMFAMIDTHPYDRDWIAQYGYGVVRQREISIPIWSSPGWIDQPADEITPDDGTTIGFSPPPPIEHGLSPAELAAFRLALSGPPGDHGIHGLILDREGLTQEDVFEMQGCSGQAELQLQNESPSGLTQSAEFAPLFEAIDQLRSDIQTSSGPEDHEWAACMSDAGHPGFERRFSAESITWAPLPQNQIRNAYEQISMNRVLRPIQLAELLEQEIGLALADFDCRVAVDFETRRSERAIAAETQFVNDHRAALNALRDAAEQRG